MPQPANNSSEPQPIQTSPWAPDSLGEAPGPGARGLAASPTLGQRFTIERLHAQGGLGQVSLALDGQLNRPVALKEIRPDRRTEDARRRFITEAEITGQLEHPGIVPIYALEKDAAGEPYYAMRFIQGRPMSQAIKEYHQTPTVLVFRDLLQRFVSVCQTVSFAHSKDVIHRDLKPANVMLGNYGETLVVDWGLAKRVVSGQSPMVSGKPDDTASPVGFGRSSDRSPEASETSLPPALVPDSRRTVPFPGDATRPGEILGTPAYAAPEQARGELHRIGAAADIFCLGGILHELLTGQPPFVGLDMAEVLRNAQSCSFAAPRSIKAETPKPLEAVCRKAMASRPEDRYASADELAQDITRWLADEPVGAYPEPWTARARRFMRRHRTLATGLGVLVTCGVIVLGLVAVLLDNARRQVAAEQARTQVALDAETKGRQRTRAVLNTVTGDVIANLLGRQQQFGEREQAFLHKLREFYQEFAAEKGESQEARAAAADGEFRLAVVQQKLHDLPAGESGYRTALGLYEKLAADFPAVSEYRRQLAHCHGNLGTLLQEVGKRRDAEIAFRQALAERTALAQQFPAQLGYQVDLADTERNFGLLLVELGKPAEAASAFRHALELLEQSPRNFPTALDHGLATAQCYLNLGILLAEIGKREDAAVIDRKALAGFEQLALEHPTVPEFRLNLARTQNNFGNLLTDLGRSKDAEESYRASVATFGQLSAEFPAVPSYRHALAASFHNLGRMLQGLGKEAEAEAAYQQALTIRQKLAGDYPNVFDYRDELAGSERDIAVLWQRAGKVADAKTAYHRAIAVQEKLAADSPSVPRYRQGLGRLLLNHGNLLATQKKQADAEAAFRRALEMQEQLVRDHATVPDYRHDVAISELNLAPLLTGLGKHDDAGKAYRHALELYQNLTTQFPASQEYRLGLAQAHSGLAYLLEHMAKLSEAAAELRSAVAIEEKLVADFPSATPYRSSLAHSLLNLATNLANNRQPEESLPSYEKAIELLQPLVAQEPRLVFQRLLLRNAHWGRAAALDGLARYADAAAEWERTLTVNNTSADEPRIRRNRAQSLARAGEHAKAVAEVNQLVTAKDLTASAIYELAFTCAIAAAAVKDDRTLQDQYAARSVELLRLAVAKGYNDVAHMKQDPDLEPLRQREDFQKLVKELEQKK